MKFCELPNQSVFTCGRNEFIKVDDVRYYNPAHKMVHLIPEVDIECVLIDKTPDQVIVFTEHAVTKDSDKTLQFQHLAKYAHFMSIADGCIFQKTFERFAINLKTFERVNIWSLEIVKPIMVSVERFF